jgi:tetraacyldisaccharide 4'-kinase
VSGPLPGFLSPVTVPASWVYRGVVAARNARYDRNGNVTVIPRPVISVGNITTGGTGKTPMVMWIVRQLVDASHMPVIAMRGYAARRGEMSDEEAQYIAELPGVPVLAHPDRVRALAAFVHEHPQVDCAVLDDGFQHRQVHRDFDLVLIDAQTRTFSDRMLPAGYLREPLENLRRADAVVVTHTDSINSSLQSQVECFHGRPPLAWTQHVWTQLSVYQNAGTAEEWLAPVSYLQGKRVLTMFGVGKPQAALDQVCGAGAQVAVNVPARDHERYTTQKLNMVRGLAKGCDCAVVTLKDWVKLRNVLDLSRWPVPIIVPQLKVRFIAGEEQLRAAVLGAARTTAAGKPAR